MRRGTARLIYIILKVLMLCLLSTFCLSQPNTVSFKIYFQSQPQNFTITKAPLKYNKDFAFSFTFDDGKEDAYTNAFPLFKGGTVVENGKTYSGLTYTDGCGNLINFRGGIAMNSHNAAGEDPHQGNNLGYIFWDQVKDLYNSGWAVYNHSYSHQAGAGTDYNFQVSENTNYILQQTGIKTTHFVIPSGDDNYTQPAFNNGMKAVYNQVNFPGADGLIIDGPIDLSQFKLYRRFLGDDNYNTSNITQLVDQIAAQSVNGQHYWFDDFTHQVTVAAQPGSLQFNTFEYYMNYIEAHYGSKGSDRVWMTSLQEVYEYLMMRENISFTYFPSLNYVEVTLNVNNVPNYLRDYALSFVVESSTDIVSVESNDISSISFKGTGANKLINLEWDQHPATIASIDPGIDQYMRTEVFPNPVDDKITLEVDSESEEEVEIFLMDIYGKEFFLAKEKIIGSTSISFNIESDLADGIYFLKLVSADQKCSVTKVLVKR